MTHDDGRLGLDEDFSWCLMTHDEGRLTATDYGRLTANNHSQPLRASCGWTEPFNEIEVSFWSYEAGAVSGFAVAGVAAGWASGCAIAGVTAGRGCSSDSLNGSSVSPGIKLRPSANLPKM